MRTLKPLNLGIAVAALPFLASTPAFSGEVAPASPAGDCFERVVRQPIYRIVTERVQGQSTVSFRDTPSVMGHGLKRVLVSKARVDHEIIPAVYRTVQRWSEAARPFTVVRSPPVFRPIQERLLISKAHLEWRLSSRIASVLPDGLSEGGQSVRPTGEVLCRILIPAKYTVVTRRVMVSPGGVHKVLGQRRRIMCNNRVLVHPARVVNHAVPALYRMVPTTFIARAATHQRVVTLGVVHIVSRQVLVTPAGYARVRLQCHVSHEAPSVPVASSSPPMNAPTPHRLEPLGKTGHTYPPGAILAPTPNYPDTFAPGLTPAPYDVGHPAR